MSVMYIRNADGTFQPVPSLQGESVSPLTVYPVGSVYISVSETSPASLFGGTWERIKDTFLLAAGDTYNAGSTGGVEQTNHVSYLPPINSNYAQGAPGAYVERVQTMMSAFLAEGGGSNAGRQSEISSIGGEANTHTLEPAEVSFYKYTSTNMPPYYAVYMWRRIS